MKLVDLSITEFAKVLGLDAPAPGGGFCRSICCEWDFLTKKWSVN